ncbi:AEC family transporter [Rhizobium sp. L1K21]|uniref:AEC family transporter n=1 Tax=Rhizobium sp. L1K21 TaxID=2954933 RepID=UPI00209249B9|nr:AEC family transporter [Rhizobium sp. L1K21]MCO6186319.1 AEC family transporter [Rhizobium sp. L1K21]
MLSVFSVTGVVFILIACGYIAVRSRFLGEAELAALMRYIMGLALPALLLNTIATRHFGDIFDTAYTGAYIIGTAIAFAYGYVISRLVWRKDATVSAFAAMGSSGSNSGFIGFPILHLIMPTVAPVALALNMIVENIVMLPAVMALAESGRGGGLNKRQLIGQIFKRLATNPLMVGMVIGLGISLANIDLPPIISRPIELMALSAAAPSLIIIGGNLALLPEGSLNLRVLVIAFGKLIVHPLGLLAGFAMLAALGIVTASRELFDAALIMAALPQMGIYVILAGRYGEEKTAAITMFLTTVVSFFTLSLLIWYLDIVPG